MKWEWSSPAGYAAELFAKQDYIVEEQVRIRAPQRLWLIDGVPAEEIRAAQQKATNDMSKIAYKPAKKDKDDKKPSKGGKGACGKAK
jgi:hypothetical protein